MLDLGLTDTATMLSLLAPAGVTRRGGAASAPLAVVPILVPGAAETSSTTAAMRTRAYDSVTLLIIIM